jgi:hypothetical protein
VPDRPQTTDLLVLAAVARAALHRGERNEATLRDVLAHLALGLRGAAARDVASRLEALTVAGRLQEGRRHGVAVWSLTPAGRRALGGATAGTPALPESPQHRAWRGAHVLALLELPRLRAALRDELRDARVLLRDPGASSEDWFALAERLRLSAWRVGSATHCLYEWAEPSDAAADVDPGGRGRRNVTLWGRSVRHRRGRR